MPWCDFKLHFTTALTAILRKRPREREMKRSSQQKTVRMRGREPVSAAKQQLEPEPRRQLHQRRGQGRARVISWSSTCLGKKLSSRPGRVRLRQTRKGCSTFFSGEQIF